MKRKPSNINAAERHDPRMRAAAAAPDNVVWHSPWQAPFRILGLGWRDPESRFRRMPLKAKWPLPEGVDALAWHTAGVQIRFRTDAARISVRVKLKGAHGMDHMPATGQCGIDAYIGETGAMTFAGVTRFSRAEDAYQVTLCNFPAAERRTVTLNLPLYQGVDELAIGLPAGSWLSAAPRPAVKRPVVVYGTSITQGGCASRPGMAYTNILSRRIDCEFINLGFSGSGRGEPEVARVIATLPAPALFLMDNEANVGGLENLKATLPPFLAILRKRWPRTVLLVVSRVPFAAEAWNPETRQRRIEARDFQRRTVARLRREGDSRIAWIDGGQLLGRDYTDCSVDGVHQTDLGFLRMADRMERPIRHGLARGR